MQNFFNILKIENFGPIKKANIEVKDMMVFIGPQASGKSTLAKLITILDDINFKQNSKLTLKEELSKYNIHSFVNKDTIIEYNTPSFSYKINNNEEYKFDIYDIIERINKLNNDLELITGTIGIMLIGIALDGKSDILFRELKKHNDYGLNENLETLFEDIYIGSEKITRKLLDLYNKNQDDENECIKLLELVKQVYSLIRPIDSLYIPAERTLLPILANNISGLLYNDVIIPKNILIAVQQFQSAIERIKDFNLDIIGTLKFKQEKDLSYIYHNKNQKVLLRESSSGVQSFLPIVLLIENTLKTENFINLNYVVEEPELNLYPEAQYKLVKYLAKNCLETNREIKTKNLIITTHSPYILASINNLLLAHNKSKINNDLTSNIIEKSSWIDSNHFNAYEVKKGKVRRIFNKKSKLIEDNIIDDVSEIIMHDFKLLAQIND
jgi:predicted ATPase